MRNAISDKTTNSNNQKTKSISILLCKVGDLNYRVTKYFSSNISIGLYDLDKYKKYTPSILITKPSSNNTLNQLSKCINKFDNFLKTYINDKLNKSIILPMLETEESQTKTNRNKSTLKTVLQTVSVSNITISFDICKIDRMKLSYIEEWIQNDIQYHKKVYLSLSLIIN
jgi:hypothetical protein